MPNYTKLFNSIVTSTIWTEDDKTRIVWITMLALADQNGEVQASVPGLARLAGVSIADAETALAKFLGPDTYSRTPDNEGRRIAKIDGGWELLNHAKYRRMASLDEAKESNAARQRRFRERNATVTDRNATVTVQTDIAEAKAKAEEKNIVEAKASTPSPKAQYPGFEDFWSAYPRKTGKGDAEKAWGKMRPPLADVLAALEWQRKEENWTKDRGQFIPMPSTYINQKRWLDEPTKPVSAGVREF